MADGASPTVDRLDIRRIAEALGVTKRGAELRAARESWPHAEHAARGGRQRRYRLADLPTDVQAAVLLRQAPQTCVEPTTNAARRRVKPLPWDEARIASVWAVHERAPAGSRAMAQRRLQALHAVERLQQSGAGLMQARQQVAAQLQRDGVRGASVASLCRWAAQVDGAPRDAWAAILLPSYQGRTAEAECPPHCWDWYKGHYLTRAKPSHADTYERVSEMAAAQGWALPSARTLIRKMDHEVPSLQQVLLREGPEAVARLVPTQQRDASVFGAGEAVNGDGLKFDRLWVKFPDGEIVGTTTGWFWQDIRTRKVLSWRVDKTESTDLFRLATYDLTAVCAPTHVWVDNTRVAANKLMTAGAAGRHRFRSDPEDGLGLLLMLGMNPHFTDPDKESGNPGAKPIERAFGIGGLHEHVATHPRFIDRGYSRETAITVEELREVVAQEVARHNARCGRRTQACGGVLSFDQAWDAALAERTPRLLTQSQRRVLLMSREVVRVDRTGIIALDAGRGPHGRNRYWSEHTAALAGQKVVALFDPENLRADVHVYSLDGRYVAPAEHKPSSAFNDSEAGREHQKLKRRRMKALKHAADAETRMTSLERAALYASATDQPPSAPEAKPAASAGNVVEGHFQRLADPARDAARRTGTDDTPAGETRLHDFLERAMAARIEQMGWTPSREE